MSSAGRVDLDLGLNYGLFQQQLNGIAGTANSLVGGAFKTLGGVIAGAFAVGGIVAFGKEAINLASDLAEVQNVVNVTFGSMTNQINNWSQNLINDFGLSELAGKKYASTMGAMLKSSGVAGESMKQMSVNLTELAADMASFYNISNDDAFYKVFSGMVGETEPLKQLGVNMSVVNMEAYAMSQGITKSWLKMTQQEQTMLRYGYLLKVTADAQGDFARNGDSWANQIRIMSEQWNIFKGTMGAGFINILAPIVKGLNWIIAKLQIAAAYFKAFTELVFGDAVNAGGAGAVPPLVDTADAAEDAGAAIGNVGDEAKKAGKKAKKAGKDFRLAGFDELNVLAKSAAGALDKAGDGAAGLGAGFAGLDGIDLGTPKIEVDPIKQQVQNLIDDLKTRFTEFWSGLQGAGSGVFDPLIKSMEPIKASIKSIGKTFIDLKNNVLVPIASYVLTDFIPSITMGFLQSFVPVIAGELVWAFDHFDRTFANITKEAGHLWTSVWLPNLDKVKVAFVTAMPAIARAVQSLLTGTLNPFVDFMANDFSIPLSAAMTETFVPLFTDTLVWAIQTFADTATNAVSHINDLWEGTLFPALVKFRDTFLDVIPKVGSSIQSLLNGTIKPFVDYALNDFIIPIAAAVTQTLVPIFADTLTWAFREAATTFNWAVGLINDAYKTVVEPVFNLIKKIVLDTLKTVKDLWDKYGADILDKLSETMTGIRNLFQKLWDDVLKPIIEPFLATLQEIWDDVLSGIITKIGEVVMKLVGAALDIYNKFISPLINYVVDQLAPGFTRGFNVILNIVKTVISGIGTMISGLLTTLGGLIDFISGVFTGDWKKAWNGVRDIFAGVFESLWGLVKVPLNLIIDGVNALIDGLNSISIDVPDWVPEWAGGGSKFGITIPKIPKLAKGGLAYGPTLAMVGDNKGASVDPEVVSPLSKLEGMINSGMQADLLKEMISALQDIRQTLQQTANRPVVLEANGTQLAQATTRASDDVSRRAGRTMGTIF